MPRIEFKDEADGTVSYQFIVEAGENAGSPAYLAAFSLAKRGLTKRDTERYKLQGGFEFKVEGSHE